MQTPRTEFAQALKVIATERGLDTAVIIETIKQAIIAAYRRDARERGEETEGYEIEAEINPTSGEARLFSYPEGKPEEKREVTPPGFGRIAAQTAKQVIHQKIREAEKGAIMDEFSARVGGLISGMVLRFDGADVRVDLGRTEGIMPASERVPNEKFGPNQRLTFLLKEIVDTPRGKQIILSRSDTKFVEKLFEREVPEILSGSVVIKMIVREPGVRTKLVVFSNQPGVDPVGSCVGQKGVRVQTITNELNGERVDIIPYSEDPVELIKAALAPAEKLSVNLKKDIKTAVVEAPSDQLSLAIGRDGQNARLTAKITGWKIKVKEVKEEGVLETKNEERVNDKDKGSQESTNDKDVENSTGSVKETTVSKDKDQPVQTEKPVEDAGNSITSEAGHSEELKEDNSEK